MKKPTDGPVHTVLSINEKEPTLVRLFHRGVIGVIALVCARVLRQHLTRVKCHVGALKDHEATPPQRAQRSQESPNQIYIDLVQKRLDELCSTARYAFDQYFRFYTVFLTFNAAALAFIIAKDSKDYGSALSHIVAAAFVVENILLIITTYKMRYYAAHASSDIVGIAQHLVDLSGEKVDDKLSLTASVFSTDLLHWSLKANIIGSYCLTGVWAVLLIWGFW